MFTNREILIRLIEEEVSKALLEQAETAPEPELEPDAAAPDAAGDLEAPEPGEDALEGGDLDLGGDTGGLDAGGLEGGEGAEDLEGDDAGDADFGGMGGGGFGGLGGGGGGFGDDGEPGLDSDQEEEEGVATTVGPEDVEIPADPVGAITDDAIRMLGQTRQPQLILRNVKSSIQRYFNDFEDATPVIKALWDTEDIVLRDVARRLLAFIRGT
jgi:hypothetical protein